MDSSEVPLTAIRGKYLPDDAFQPPLQHSKLDDPLKKLQVGKIVGTQGLESWSPSATNCYACYTDILVSRFAADAGNVLLHGQAWKSAIVTPRMMLRRKDAGMEWHICLGCLDGMLLKLWPAEETPDDDDG